jgi:hypothetical protein
MGSHREKGGGLMVDGLIRGGGFGRRRLLLGLWWTGGVRGSGVWDTKVEAGL